MEFTSHTRMNFSFAILSISFFIFLEPGTTVFKVVHGSSGDDASSDSRSRSQSPGVYNALDVSDSSLDRNLGIKLHPRRQPRRFETYRPRFDEASSSRNPRLSTTTPPYHQNGSQSRENQIETPSHEQLIEPSSDHVHHFAIPVLLVGGHLHFPVGVLEDHVHPTISREVLNGNSTLRSREEELPNEEAAVPRRNRSRRQTRRDARDSNQS